MTVSRRRRVVAGAAAAAVAWTPASWAPATAAAAEPLLAIAGPEDAVGAVVRVAVYDSAERFLDTASARFEGVFGPDGVALIPLGDVEAGVYAMVAYLDDNRDGRLNRGKLGRPKEPFAFTNGVRPKLSAPDFDDARVEVARDDVVVIRLER